MVFNADLRVVSHDVIKAGQQAQTGTDLHMHGSVNIIKEVQSLVDQFTALLQETWKGGKSAVKYRSFNQS